MSSTDPRICISARTAMCPLGDPRARNRGRYMPCPSSMAGCIEDALSGQNLQGNVGERRRRRRARIDVEGCQVMRALGKSNPRVTDVRCRLPVASVATRKLRVALMAGGRNTQGRTGSPRREAPAVACRTWKPQETRCWRRMKLSDGLRVPSRPHCFLGIRCRDRGGRISTDARSGDRWRPFACAPAKFGQGVKLRRHPPYPILTTRKIPLHTGFAAGRFQISGYPS